ncbi:NADH-quinone oxidoreductase subunit B [Actinomadura sp. KC06]|nr:NADH-quinone oxidoreductase subunit B [Actinomadura sp. KC06]
MGTIDLPPPSVGPLSRLAPKPVKFVLNWGRRYSLWVFNFGLACCAIEFIATSMSRHDFIRLGVIPFAPGPRQADLMVVSGTVSDKMAPAVRRLYEQMPEPKYVISFGACSNCGGPYWDSYCVTKGVDQVIPVDVYVPGCPPRPEALLHGIVRLQEKIAGESLGDRYAANGPGGEPVSPSPAPRPLSATVLRRPIQPPPPPPAADAGDTTELPEGGDEVGPNDETVPVWHLGEPEPEPPAAEAPAEGPAAQTAEVPIVEGPTEEVPVVSEIPPGVHPADDVTMPVPSVDGDAAAENDHDPSIIPGLTDDGHDDEIGRDR